MSAAAVPHVSEPPPRRLRQRLLEPIRLQLTQGVSSDRIAATLAVGTACSLFPFLGLTTLLNGAVGVLCRMNQPILQTLNQLLGPLQLVLILLHVRIGEVIWGRTADAFTVGEMIGQFRELSLGEFLQRFGAAGIHALTAWAVIWPGLSFVLYFALRPLLRRVARSFVR